MKNAKIQHIAVKKTPIEGIYQVKGQQSGPTITILGGTHGNELAGIEIVDSMLLNPPKVKKGTLNLGFSNPKAIAQGTRFVDFDLNRCFGNVKGITGYEVERAQMLKYVLETTSLGIDLHSTIKPSEPMILVPGTRTFTDVEDMIIDSLPIQRIVYGKGLYGPEIEGPQKPHSEYTMSDVLFGAEHTSHYDTPYVDTYIAKHGNAQPFEYTFGKKEFGCQSSWSNLGITIEAGQLNDLSMVEKLTESLTLIVEALCGTGQLPYGVRHKDYEAYECVVAKQGFAFTKEYNNFDLIEEGDLFATAGDAGGIHYRAPCDSFILFPKSPDNIVPGLEACVLLEKEQEVHYRGCSRR